RAFGAIGAPTCTSPCYQGWPDVGAGELHFPTGAAVAPAGDVYVAEYGNNRIAEFTQSGVFVRAFGKGVNPGDGGGVCTTRCRAGSAGGAAGQLWEPVAVAVAPTGDVYVVDRVNQRVSEFTQSGTFVRAFGKDVNSDDGSDVCTTS